MRDIKGAEMLIKNVNIANYNGEIHNTDILIKSGKIANIGKNIGKQTKRATIGEIIDGTNLYAFAGFVDLHCHLRDPGFTHKEDVITGTRAAVSGGYTTICCMPNTKPCIDNVETLSYVINKSKEEGYARVLPVACITKGMLGKELTDFARLQDAVAFSDDGLPVLDEEILISAFSKADAENKLLMLHEEDIALRGDGEVHGGEHAKIAGLKGIGREVEDNLTKRDTELALKHNARLHICHVSTEGSVDIIRQAKKQGAKITCETTPHYISLDDSLLLNYTPMLKVNPPIREKSDVLAVIEGIADGTIDAIATDHAPHTLEEKAQIPPPFGMIGLQTAFAVCYTYLVKRGIIPLTRLIELMSKSPSDIIKLHEGEIAQNMPASLSIWDLEQKYVYNKEDIVSKSKNSPFVNYTLYGKLKCTIVEGEVKYDNR